MPAPAADIRVAGITKCEDFLEKVATGRIITRPWIEAVTGRRVRFSDGACGDFDNIIFATGYHLSLPFLDAAIQDTLALERERIALYKHSFHPDLPGLAFVGFYNQVGPYFPILELQARWIAYRFSGRLEAPGEADMRAGLQLSLEQWSTSRTPMHQLALLFAREIDALPEPRDWPEISRWLVFGPLCPALFRLCGTDALKDAPQRVAAAGRAYGMITNNSFSQAERERMAQLGIALDDRCC